MLSEIYERYRGWAARFGQTGFMVASACAGVAGGVLVILMGRDWALWRFLPWVAAIGGPVAALDAYGAAAHRGAPREGLARALLILAVSWCFPAYVFYRGRHS